MGTLLEVEQRSGNGKTMDRRKQGNDRPTEFIAT